jgi:hypothetical protein
MRGLHFPPFERRRACWQKWQISEHFEAWMGSKTVHPRVASMHAEAAIVSVFARFYQSFAAFTFYEKTRK